MPFQGRRSLLKDLQYRTVGVISYWGISDDEPIGKPLEKCAMRQITLQLVNERDYGLAKRSVSALRQERIRRLTHEAVEQGVALSLDELALILTSSLSTIVRDVAELRRQGETIPTRGHLKDIGRSIEARIELVKLYLNNFSCEEIATKLCRPLEDVRRPIERFEQAADLLRKRMSPEKVARVVHISPRLILKYMELIKNQL
jgi:biotin operon repressor